MFGITHHGWDSPSWNIPLGNFFFFASFGNFCSLKNFRLVLLNSSFIYQMHLFPIIDLVIRIILFVADFPIVFNDYGVKSYFL